MIGVQDLPALNAALNTGCTLCLSFGYAAIRRGDRDVHRRWMLRAVTLSALFLTSYVIYHANAGSVPYPLHDLSRPVYFAILIPHVILAAVMTPFVLLLLAHALRGRFALHARLARWIWPVWMFVSISGVAVYLMLYHWAGAQPSVAG